MLVDMVLDMRSGQARPPVVEMLVSQGWLSRVVGGGFEADTGGQTMHRARRWVIHTGHVCIDMWRREKEDGELEGTQQDVGD